MGLFGGGKRVEVCSKCGKKTLTMKGKVPYELDDFLGMTRGQIADIMDVLLMRDNTDRINLNNTQRRELTELSAFSTAHQKPGECTILTVDMMKKFKADMAGKLAAEQSQRTKPLF
ncbi:MAG: hypothetical protein FWE38_04080 [Firmicutes bacterium]|nr:hypothetical protein [Bacillota bacterium]